ncbi:Transmembrane domain-containing protein [Spironucleus salmonicida]|uniref:Transmembrane domain-containing protein n=1 Tax=Spironucleus salmonicida TaxID=348837 RepID=V6LM53_9EUKA|nr:Transmembrane domain-containing protein [Spironucleus salmonicida]|eukprot:EST44786.1 Transmembrane domain-containing protein [Spironucleus salmonicida]
MHYSYCSYFKNMCSRLIYSLIIAIFITVIAIFTADILQVTMSFSKFVYHEEEKSTTFTSIGEPIKIESTYFKFELPGIAQIATRTDGQKCLSFNIKNKATTTNIGTKYHESLFNIVISDQQQVTCIDSTSYDNLANGFLYHNMDLMVAILVIAVLLFLVILTICIWCCCDGFCGCRCCNLFTMCCDADRQENNVSYIQV